MHYRRVPLLLITAAGLLGVQVLAHGSIGGGLPGGKPGAGWKSGLGPEVVINGYGVRPPRGYQVTVPEGAPPGCQAWAWTSAPRADLSRGFLLVTFAKLTPRDKSFKGPESMVDG